MNSLEFIKQHVTEWPSTDQPQITNHVKLLRTGTVMFGESRGKNRMTCIIDVDISEHFAPNYYDGKVWTRDEFEACGKSTSIDSRDNLNDGKKYEATIIGLCGTAVKIDIYRVLDAYPQVDPHIEHLIKKALKPGERGHKDKRTDYLNIIESAQKALILLDQKERLNDAK